jgi:diaminopimelate decarboxylase
LRSAARRYGTPVYVTDIATLDRAARELAAAFADPWLRQFSVKANDVRAIVQLIAACGFGANVVSRGEWAAARTAGVPNERTTLEGIGKTPADLRAAIAAAGEGRPLRWVSLESVDEAVELTRLANQARLALPLDVLFRLNPAVSPETHRGLAVGAGGSKFGLTEAEVSQAIETVGGGTGPIRPRGIHIHVGSQLGAVDAWRDAVRRGLALLALLRGSLGEFDTLDVGGGFPVAPRGEPAPAPERFARELPPLLDALPVDRRPSRLAIEPGRYLVARAGFLVARVLHARNRVGRQVVLDTGMTELIRPALYSARHSIAPLTSLGRADPSDGASFEPTRVDGPICESTDSLGDHVLPPLRRGDLVAIRDAGAYAASFSSSYNGRPRPPQVLLEPDGRLRLARPRGRLRP